MRVQPADPDDRAGPLSLVVGGVTPEKLCAAAVAALDITGAGVSMMTAEGNSATVCASGEVAARIEELQFTLGEGPCVDAFLRGPVLVDDLTATSYFEQIPWPAFATAAAAAGVRALFAFPVQIGAIRVGAFDLYRDRPGPLSDLDLSLALQISDAIALSLVGLQDGSAGSRGEDVTKASMHLEVHQATGLLKVYLGITIEEAFVRLRAYAYANDLDVNDVAREVVAGRLQLDEEDG